MTPSPDDTWSDRDMIWTEVPRGFQSEPENGVRIVVVPHMDGPILRVKWSVWVQIDQVDYDAYYEHQRHPAFPLTFERPGEADSPVWICIAGMTHGTDVTSSGNAAIAAFRAWVNAGRPRRVSEINAHWERPKTVIG